MFKRAYVEITNICNMHCTFCHGTKRPKAFMSCDDFRTVAEKLRPHTEYLYLHVLGEPLLHLQLKEILQIAADLDFRVNITTNGSLLGEKKDILFGASALRKVSVSLHSFEGSGEKGSLEDYLEKVWSYCERATAITALRLWNEGGSNALNEKIVSFLSEKRSVDVTTLPSKNGSRKLGEHLYLETAEKFEWPDKNAGLQQVEFCHGLSQQIAVLCDGTVVPCCLDCEGNIALGNLYKEDMNDILEKPRTKAMIQGFQRRMPSEELCKRCQYASRFHR